MTQTVIVMAFLTIGMIVLAPHQEQKLMIGGALMNRMAVAVAAMTTLTVMV